MNKPAEVPKAPTPAPEPAGEGPPELRKIADKVEPPKEEKKPEGLPVELGGGKKPPTEAEQKPEEQAAPKAPDAPAAPATPAPAEKAPAQAPAPTPAPKAEKPAAQASGKDGPNGPEELFWRDYILFKELSDKIYLTTFDF